VTLTRIRLEGHADNAILLKGELLDAWQRARGEELGDWMIEDEEYIPANEGTWGRLTLRRKDTRHEPQRVQAGSDTAGDGTDH
jgi:hypothetical protein